jgi:hypothetical protein
MMETLVQQIIVLVGIVIILPTATMETHVPSMINAIMLGIAEDHIAEIDDGDERRT